MFNVYVIASFLCVFVNLSYCKSSLTTINYPVATTEKINTDLLQKSRWKIICHIHLLNN